MMAVSNTGTTFTGHIMVERSVSLLEATCTCDLLVKPAVIMTLSSLYTPYTAKCTYCVYGWLEPGRGHRYLQPVYCAECF